MVGDSCASTGRESWRRGSRRLGYGLLGLGAFTFTAMLAALVLEESIGREMPSFWRISALIGVLVPLGVFATERRPYAEARRAGAVDARWWPPLIVFVVALLVD